ncbi:MAG: serine protease, partial [Planctomycetota bacterium]
GLVGWFRKKPNSDGPKTIDDPFAAADPAGFASGGSAPAFAADADFGEAPTGRAGSDVPPASPNRDPMQTVVRIQVFDDAGLNFGSGTIIASRPGRAIALTCGHIFRTHKPGGRIEVETFDGGRVRPWPATLIGYDKTSDVGLLAIDCPEVLPASALAPPGVAPGDRVVSVGCDGGEAPNRQGHVVQRAPAYRGPQNFSCTGQPQLGRSGGGCFDSQGRLIGVVWSRSEDPPEGIYTAIEPINALLDRHGLTALKAPPAAPAPGATPTDTTPAADTFLADGGAPAADPAATNGIAATDREIADEMLDALFDASAPETPIADANSNGSAGSASTASAAAAAALGGADGAEITCIIRPLGPDGGPTRIVVINQATPRTLALLQGDAAGGAVETSLFQPRPALIPSSFAQGDGIERQIGDAPVTRCRRVRRRRR